MNRQELYELHKRLTTTGLELMTRKNADYGADSDPFHNFRMAALLRLKPAQGVMLRMQDKMARLVTFLEKGELQVKTESWEDACIDLINYTVILAALLHEQAGQQPKEQEPGGPYTLRRCPKCESVNAVNAVNAVVPCTEARVCSHCSHRMLISDWLKAVPVV